MLGYSNRIINLMIRLDNWFDLIKLYSVPANFCYLRVRNTFNLILYYYIYIFYLLGILKNCLLSSWKFFILVVSSFERPTKYASGATVLQLSFSALNSVLANSATDINSWREDSSVTDWRLSRPHSYPSLSSVVYS